jgi:hypothetical protein
MTSYFLPLPLFLVAKLADGFNGADLRNICTEAGELVVYSGGAVLMFVFVIVVVFLSGFQFSVLIWGFVSMKVVVFKLIIMRHYTYLSFNLLIF